MNIHNIPYNEDAELGLINIILLNKNALFPISHLFSENLFYLDHYKQIANIMIYLFESNNDIDMVTVSAELNKRQISLPTNTAVFLSQVTAKEISFNNIYYYIETLIHFHIQRELHYIAIKILDGTYFNEKKTIFQYLNELNRKLDLLNINNKINKISKIDDVISKHYDDLENKPIQKIYDTGMEAFDKRIAIVKEMLLLLVAKKGHGKTKFIWNLAISLLSRHDDIGICWYCMEDGEEKMINFFLSYFMRLDDKQIKQSNYKLNQFEIEEIKKLLKVFRTYDIEFVSKSSSILEIKTHFKYFCQLRPNKLNILIIDNLMLLSDQLKTQNDTDDFIAKQLQIIKEETKGSIFCVHHFNKDSDNKDGLKTGFRPTDRDVRGSGRITDVMTQVLLLNKPGKYKELVAEYKGKEDILKYLLILDIVKNRDGNDVDDSVIRYFTMLEYNIFIEIDELLKLCQK